MKIMVDVHQAGQTWDFDTKKTQHFLVVEIFGILHRVPCTEAQLMAAIGKSRGHAVPPAPPRAVESEPDEWEGPGGAPTHWSEPDESSPVSANPMFNRASSQLPEEEPPVEANEPAEGPAPAPAAPKPDIRQLLAARRNTPASRKPVIRGSDDSGISQG